MDIVERFLKYVSYPTTSFDEVETCPSNPAEFALRDVLAEELKEMGITDIIADDLCYLYATIPANTEGIPRVAFIAHLDTSSSSGGENIKAIRTVRDGKEIICTDGTTLLGGDDKAGMAAIMSMAEELMMHPEILHGEVHLMFTPDEEVGRSQDHVDYEKLQADFAYTVDGGDCRELEAQNMYGHTMIVNIKGVNAHPGYGKGIMKSAAYIGMEYAQMMPETQKSYLTEGWEAFHHLARIEGSTGEAKLIYFIRNATAEGIASDLARMNAAADYLNLKYGEGTVEVVTHSTRLNMIEGMKDKMYVYDLAYDAIKNVCGEVLIPICRGGFDGIELTFNGVPCPNLGAGDYNMHACDEYVVIDEMRKSKDILLEIIRGSVSRFSAGKGE